MIQRTLRQRKEKQSDEEVVILHKEGLVDEVTFEQGAETRAFQAAGIAKAKILRQK